MAKFKPIIMLVNMILFIIFLTPICVQAAEAQQDIQILSMADIHFDPFVSCQGQKPCALIQALRAAPVSEWSAIFRKQDESHPQYRQDSDYALLMSALTAAKEAAEKNHVQTIFVLGDFLGHDYRSLYRKYSQDNSRASYRQFAYKTMQFLTMQIAKNFPNKNVYALIGNNDSYRGDYRFDAEGAFFADMSSLFANLVSDPTNKAIIRKSLGKGGYYAVPITSNTTLIALNSVLFSAKAKPKEASALAEQQLAWLHQQLLSAKANNKHVMIAMHIPVGIDVYATLKYRWFRLIEFWDRTYTEKFDEELREFAPEIVGIFAGHLHSDWFQMLQVDNSNTIPITGTPSISPIFGNNPGFKIYQYSPTDAKLKNFQTYYDPLDKQSSWGVEYSFDKIYQPNCIHCDLQNGMKLLKPSNALAEYYKRFYAVSTTSQPITTKWLPYYWCAVQEISADKYKKCLA